MGGGTPAAHCAAVLGQCQLHGNAAPHSRGAQARAAQLPACRLSPGELLQTALQPGTWQAFAHPPLVCRPLHAFHLGRGEPQGSNYHCTAAARQVLASESGVCPASAGDCAEGLPGWHDELTAGCALLQAARPAIRKIRCGQRFLTVMAAKPADAGAPCTATAFIVPLCQPCAWGSANSPPKPTLHRATYRLQCQCCCHAVEMSCMHLCRLTAVAPPAGRLAG